MAADFAVIPMSNDDLPIAERVPPQNIDAEETILGGLMMDPEALTRVIEFLKPETFYVDSHKEIYRAALALHATGRPTDLVSLMTWLEDNKLLEKVGGRTYLRRLTDAATNTINIDQYATLVANKYALRMLIRGGQEIASLGYDTAADIPKLFDMAEEKLFAVTQERVSRTLVPASEVLMNVFEQLESRFEQGSNIFGIPTDFYDLDNYTQGLQPSDLIIVAGRPGMGKCCSKNTRIVDPETGSLRTIEAICKSGSEGKSVDILTLLPDLHLAQTQPSHFIDDGIKPIFKVTTRLGREVETTLSHPYLTIHGWKPLTHLKVGTRIAVPRILPIFGHKEICETEIVQLMNIFESSAHDTSLPEAVFCLPKAQMAQFLRHLFAINQLDKKISGEIAYSSPSKQLCKDLQHLLLRFGIIASLTSQKVENSTTHILKITEYQDLLKFVQEIGIFGQRELLRDLEAKCGSPDFQLSHETLPMEVWDFILQEKGDLTWEEINLKIGKPKNDKWPLHQDPPNRNAVAALAKAIQSELLWSLANSDLYWDEIVAIEAMGMEQVYDLTVPSTHNFVAADIFLHNTSFALTIAQKVTQRAGLPAVVFSLEMSREQLVQRLLCAEAEVESHRLRSARISENEWQRVGQAIGRLAALPLYIDDSPNATVTEIRSKARRLQAEQGGRLGLVMIDYLQLMEGAGSDNRVQELSKITRGLKGLARELRVPVMALSQLSRGVEARNNKRPMLSDLRESGSIEQDADIVMMLYRDDYYNPDSPDRNIAEVNLVKHRNGPTGTVKLLFENQFTRFMNLSTSQQ
jgi:replicative DNA helicase